MKTLLEISEKYDAHGILLNVTGGEPLLRKNMAILMYDIKKLGYNWGMTTNGILINKEVRDFDLFILSMIPELINEVGFDQSVRVSLYFYNTKEEIEKLVDLLSNKDKIIKEMLV